MIARKLAEYTVGLRDTDIPPEALHAARRCVVDWFAAAISGGGVGPASMLAAGLAGEGARGRAMVLPSGDVTAARAAALINGAASHTMEVDDIFRDAIYHPGAPVIAAVLAAAQDRGVSGAEFLRGVIAGYEVSNRIGRAVVPAHYEYWHTTATVGAFGAAAGAALIMGLDAGRAAHGLANAATLAAGLQQAFRSDAMSKPFHVGRAAETGVLVALAAEHGVTGAAGMFEGARGFAAAMSRDVDWDAAFADLGQDYTITRTTQKNHSACGHGFAAIDGVIALRAEHGLAPADVKRITVGTYGKALEILSNDHPETAFEAKFSLPYCAAVAMLTGRVRLAAFSPERLADPALRALMARVELHIDEAADAAFPGRRSAVVGIETTDGRAFRHHAPTRKGDPENPLSDAEISDKFHELVAPVIGDGAAESLLETLWQVDALGDMAALPFAAPARARTAAQ